jgi:hypothetical protein
MGRIRRTAAQSALIIGMAVLLGVGVNLLRPDGLPMVQAQGDAVTCPGTRKKSP